MIIPIRRIYLNSGMVADILINTRYIIKIEPTSELDESDKPRTRILMEGFGGSDDKLTFIYTNDSVHSLKIRLTKASKVQRDD